MATTDRGIEMTESPSRGSELDRERSAAFLGDHDRDHERRALALMCSIGHKTGLFDTLAAMAGDGPATSHQIAEAASLDERYVREWLAAMARRR